MIRSRLMMLQSQWRRSSRRRVCCHWAGDQLRLELALQQWCLYGYRWLYIYIDIDIDIGMIHTVWNMLPLIIIKIYFNLKFSNILLRVFRIQSWYITSHISQYGVSILVNIAVSSTHTEVFGTLPLTAWSAQCTNDTLIVWRPVSTDTWYLYYTMINSTPPSSVSKSAFQ